MAWLSLLERRKPASSQMERAVVKEITQEKFCIEHIDVMDYILGNISIANANMDFT